MHSKRRRLLYDGSWTKGMAAVATPGYHMGGLGALTLFHGLCTYLGAKEDCE